MSVFPRRPLFVPPLIFSSSGPPPPSRPQKVLSVVSRSTSRSSSWAARKICLRPVHSSPSPKKVWEFGLGLREVGGMTPTFFQSPIMLPSKQKAPSPLGPFDPRGTGRILMTLSEKFVLFFSKKFLQERPPLKSVPGGTFFKVSRTRGCPDTVST